MSLFKRWFGKRDDQAEAEEGSPQDADEQALEQEASDEEASAGEEKENEGGGRKAKGAKGDGVIEIRLAPLIKHFKTTIPLLEHKDVDMELCWAKLLDRLRDAGYEPLEGDYLSALMSMFGDEARRRFALLVSAVQSGLLGSQFGQLLEVQGVASFLGEAMIMFVMRSDLLTMDVLRKSSLRVEEFARAFIRSLGAQIQGETEQHSIERLARLDYARLLSEADQAKLSAEERMKYLKKLQEEEAQRHVRRGKW